MSKLNQSTQSSITLIRYQCNYCGRLRKLIIPKHLIKATGKDLLEKYIDVHRCKNEEYSAIVCFIDNNLAVRSQTRIKATHAGYEPERDFTEKNDANDPFAQLKIPMPKKTSFAKKQVETFMFFSNNIEGLTIKDRLRSSLYCIAKDKGEKTINVISRLGFVEITVYLKKATVDKIYEEWQNTLKSKKGSRKFPYDDVRKWIQVLANELESVVTLDEQMLSYIAEYLDRYIIVEPEEAKLAELVLLLHMTISLPYCDPKQLERFNNEGSKTIPKVTIVDLRNMRDVLELSLNNMSKTLKDIYDEQTGIGTFSDFIKAIYLLEKYGYLTLHKLSFDDY
ncbi:MAG: hypothetical protein ACTSYD_11120 [Candidatus Heimdallarchaeaceae archaeon]